MELTPRRHLAVDLDSASQAALNRAAAAAGVLPARLLESLLAEALPKLAAERARAIAAAVEADPELRAPLRRLEEGR